MVLLHIFPSLIIELILCLQQIPEPLEQFNIKRKVFILINLMI